MEIRLKLDLMSGIWKQRRKNGGHSGLGNHMIKDEEVEMKGLWERRDCQKNGHSPEWGTEYSLAKRATVVQGLTNQAK